MWLGVPIVDAQGVRRGSPAPRDASCRVSQRSGTAPPRNLGLDREDHHTKFFGLTSQPSALWYREQPPRSFLKNAVTAQNREFLCSTAASGRGFRMLKTSLCGCRLTALGRDLLELAQVHLVELLGRGCVAGSLILPPPDEPRESYGDPYAGFRPSFAAGV